MGSPEASSSGIDRRYDVMIVGAGVLGASIAFWLSEVCSCDIILLDREGGAGMHESSRNTGITHRPFYLDPSRKGVLARSAELSYSMWSALAERLGLPWKVTGLLEVARDERSLAALDRYMDWAVENGMEEGEVSLLGREETRGIEPCVEAPGSILSLKEASVDYGAFARALADIAEANGVRVAYGAEAISLSSDGTAGVRLGGNGRTMRIAAGLVVNAGGANALQIARMEGLGGGYAEMYFRGDYWRMKEGAAPPASRQIYSVPMHPEYPFLDPHLIRRYSGISEVGPNAAPVPGPYAYGDVGGWFGVARGLLAGGGPLRLRLKLLSSSEFLSMARDEWRSSLSRDAMISRVSSFIPCLRADMFDGRGISGIRGNLIGPGGFVPDVVLLRGSRSLHILNYNSPGATGAPAFSANLVNALYEDGFLPGRGGLQPQGQRHPDLWDLKGSLLEEFKLA